MEFRTKSVSDSGADNLDIDGKVITKTVTVKDPEKSGDANLSNITVSQGELYPSFAYNITSYTATVEYKTEEVVVGYKTSNGNASAKISGSNKLNVGDNKRTITVTAENGSTKTYTVNVIRAQEDGTLPDGTNYYEIKKQNALGITIDEKEFMILDDFKGIRVPDGFSLDVVSYNEFDIPVIVAKKTGIRMGYITPVDSADSSVKAKWMFFDEKEKTFTDSYVISSDEVLDQTKYLLFGDDEPEEPEPEPEKPASLLDDPVLLYIILGTLALLFLVILILQFMIISSKASDKKKKKAKKETSKKEVSE
ncbi:MAG: cadherin-like beta sandwich domain-containing protein [Clostridia bacterium]|nr:cadherin-like beta sandwich domain-containing protein [Clostridia bacterium]